MIFLSNFLALLVKVDAAGEGRRETLGGIMVALNVFLVIAVIFTSWMATQQSVEDFRENEDTLAMTTTMLTAERATANYQRTARSRNQDASMILPVHRPKETPRRSTPARAAEVKASAKIGPVSASVVESLWRKDQKLGPDASRPGRQALQPAKREEEPDMI